MSTTTPKWTVSSLRNGSIGGTPRTRNRPAGNYGIDPSWGQEQHRLALIEKCYDPMTIARLTALGVGPGWRCLEIGAGGGSIARWLRDRVGPEGRVVAIDLDTRCLADEPGLEARSLAATLKAAGLGAVEARGDVGLVRGATAEAEILRLSVEAMRERMPDDSRQGSRSSTIRRSDDPTIFEPGIIWYTAWGQRKQRETG